jgi:transcriptional regulator with XRE-family HTH domain
MLKLNIKTAGDWLKVKRMEKNLTPGHVAAKMSIATSLVCSWESRSRRPDSQQLKVLSSVLGFDAKDLRCAAAADGKRKDNKAKIRRCSQIPFSPRAGKNATLKFNSNPFEGQIYNLPQPSKSSFWALHDKNQSS